MNHIQFAWDLVVCLLEQKLPDYLAVKTGAFLAF